ncbi:MAG: peptidoglycan DD-metalloendopeptidase family protein [Candidatus Limnocylindrales bacterium]
MPSPASPALRVLRRLVARNPETPIRLEFSRTRASVAASLRGLTRTAVAPVNEILGDTPDVPSRLPGPPAVETAAAGAAQDSFSRRLAPLTRHRRLLPLGSCLLLLVIAAGSALAPVSAASGGQQQPGPSPVASAGGGVSGLGNTTVDQTQPDSGGYTYDGDGSIYNVMQAVEIPAGSSGFQTYVVKGGDSLSKIAAKFGLAYTTIYWANTSRLPNPSSIGVGLKLLIPPVDGVLVSVKAKDTLSSLASKYHSSVAKIISANDLSGSMVTVGQTLIIPCTPPAIPAPPTPRPGCQAGCGSTVWNGGRLTWPVPGQRRITQRFGCTGFASEPRYGSCAHFHDAIDIGAPEGSPVVAAAGGTVIFAGWKYAGSAGYGGGLVVWISHGGKLWTTYNHLSAEFVHVGQVVAAGQRIGNVGMTGNATGPHLHFEVWACYPWTGGTLACARNPLNYL